MRGRTGTKGVATALGDDARLKSLYDEDPYAWSLQQADAMRALAAGRDAPLDLPRLIEELDGMAAAEQRAVESLTARIIEHLLLLEHSSATAPRRGWRAEVVTFRQDLELRLTPALRQHLERILDKVYDRARSGLASKLAIYDETEVASRLPAQRPYTLDQINGRWLPD